MRDDLNNPVNFFVSEELNKLTQFRINKEWLKEKFYNGNSKIIPIKESKILIDKNEETHPVYLSSKDFKSDDLILEQIIFIGQLRDKIYFAIDIDENKKELKINIDDLGEYQSLRKVAPLLEPEEAAVISIAKSMSYWHAKHIYCGACGNKTYPVDAGHKRLCSNPACKMEHFPRTDPAIIVLVSKGDKCLLARQSKWRKNQYATVAGFVEPGETLEQAIAREVYEETGVIVDKASYHSSQPWPFPGTIMLGFLANAKTTEITLHDHELEDAKWFTRDQIRKSLNDGSLLLSPPISVSFRLIESWFDQENAGELSRIIKSL